MGPWSALAVVRDSSQGQLIITIGLIDGRQGRFKVFLRHSVHSALLQVTNASQPYHHILPLPS
jgi:hypothetical protein